MYVVLITVITFGIYQTWAQLPSDLCQPYGVRVSLGQFYTYQYDNEDMIDILFNTNVKNASCPDSFVEISLVDKTFNSTVFRMQQLEVIFLDMGDVYKNNVMNLTFTYTTYIHRVQISNLNPGLDYEYIVQGIEDRIAGPYQIKIPSKLQEEGETKRIIFFGDMDSHWVQNNSKNTFDWFIDQAHNNRSQYDLLLFNGDLAYNLESEDCQTGDYFLRNLSTFTPYWPLLVTPGNHDQGANRKFTMLKNEFYSPEVQGLDTDDIYYNIVSFDLGYAHFIQYNPIYFVYNLTKEIQDKIKTVMLDALRKEFIKAQFNRDQVPWLIVYSHYPLYCSGYQDIQCIENFEKLSDFEDLFKEFKLDLYIAAHQHSYERDAPTFKNKTVPYLETSGDLGQHFIQEPQAPVYIVEGIAGNDYFIPDKVYPNSQYTVAQSVNIGVGILSVINRTHLYFEQVGAKGSTKEDYFYLIKQDSSQNLSYIQWVWIILGILIGVLLIVGLCVVAYKFMRKIKSTQSLQNSQAIQIYDT